MFMRVNSKCAHQVRPPLLWRGGDWKGWACGLGWPRSASAKARVIHHDASQIAIDVVKQGAGFDDDCGFQRLQGSRAPAPSTPSGAHATPSEAVGPESSAAFVARSRLRSRADHRLARHQPLIRGACQNRFLDLRPCSGPGLRLHHSYQRRSRDRARAAHRDSCEEIFDTALKAAVAGAAADDVTAIIEHLSRLGCEEGAKKLKAAAQQ
jgi:hypothetical protein